MFRNDCGGIIVVLAFLCLACFFCLCLCLDCFLNDCFFGDCFFETAFSETAFSETVFRRLLFRRLLLETASSFKSFYPLYDCDGRASSPFRQSLTDFVVDTRRSKSAVFVIFCFCLYFSYRNILFRVARSTFFYRLRKKTTNKIIMHACL